MEQITGALVGIALVLSAVFVPMAFFGGSAGVIYRQFSITIVSSMILSVLVALIFTPALTPRSSSAPSRARRSGAASSAGSTAGSRAARPVTPSRCRESPGAPHGRSSRYSSWPAVAALGYLRLPGGYLPEEDQGFMFVQVTAPPGATELARAQCA